MVSYRYAAMTDVGLRRSDNQDSGYASPHLLLIADGMGGAAAGDLASSEVTQIMRRLDGPLEGEPDEALAGAVQKANDRLGYLIDDDPSVEGMGTTLTALLFDGEKFTMAHVGDSRAYRLRDGELIQLSDDHTFVQSLVDEGRISPEEAREHPHRSLILRALLGRDDNGPDIDTVEVEVGDRLLLCSDGLTDMVPEVDVQRVLGDGSLDEAAVELIRLALEGGGVDNVTVILAEITDDDAEDQGSSADGKPQLVGAAAAGPQPRRATSGDESAELDPEEARYAPQPPSRWRKARLITLILLVFALVGAAAWWTYDWSQKQYYVGEDNGQVVIYRGVQAEIPGITLQQIEEPTGIEVDDLPPAWRQQVRDGINASSRAEAEETVERLRAAVLGNEGPDDEQEGDEDDDDGPSPSPSPSPSPTAATP